MSKSVSVSVGIICLFVLLLASCSNTFCKNTGSICIALPGTDSARLMGYQGPTDEEKSVAEYTVKLISNNQTIQRTASGGENVIVDELLPGNYEVIVYAHTGTGYYQGKTKKSVTVTEDSTTLVSVDLNKQVLFYKLSNSPDLKFEVHKIPEDTSYDECYLMGTHGICLKPNRDLPNVDHTAWTGVWPFKSNNGGKFYLAGTYDGCWHDNVYSQYEIDVPESMFNTSAWSLPSDSALNSYENSRPEAYGVYQEINWNSLTNDNVLSDIIGQYSPCEIWCEIELWKGTDTNTGSWFDGVHIQHIENDENCEFYKFFNDGIELDDLCWYLHKSHKDETKQTNYVSADIGDEWFIIASIIIKPVDDNGDQKAWQIVLPRIESDALNWNA